MLLFTVERRRWTEPRSAAVGVSALLTGELLADPAAVVVDVALPIGGGGGPQGVAGGTSGTLVAVGGESLAETPLNFVSHSPLESTTVVVAPPPFPLLLEEAGPIELFDVDEVMMMVGGGGGLLEEGGGGCFLIVGGTRGIFSGAGGVASVLLLSCCSFVGRGGEGGATITGGVAVPPTPPPGLEPPPPTRPPMPVGLFAGTPGPAAMAGKGAGQAAEGGGA